jgi:Cyclic nucleotide-binding domain
MTDERRLAPVGAALRNADLRRVLVAYFASVVSEWALWTGLLVYSYEQGGRTVAGLVSLGLFVPGMLLAPFAGAAADGPRPNRVLAMVYVVQSVTLGVAVVAAYSGGALLTVVVPAATALAVICYIRPCFSVVVPGLVTSPVELTAANLLTGYADGASVLIGPLLASALIAIGGPSLVLALCASLAVLGTSVTVSLVKLDPGAAAQPATERAGSRTRALVDGVRALGQRKGALQLLAVLGGQYVLIGSLDLIYVVLATEEFGLGSSGPGVLGAAFGVGAVLGGAASTMLIARKRLAPLMMISLVAICVALLAIAGLSSFAVALIALPIAGLGRAVLDLTGRMLMQRAAPQEALASIFATMESLALVASAVGSIVAQVVIAVSGVRSATLAVAVLLGALLLITSRRLLLVDASADAPVVAIRLLRRIPVFAPLPGPALEGVARAAEPVRRAAGSTIIQEGEAGESYFAIVTGEVEITVEGQFTRTMTRGQGFGEIALLAELPRTATAVAKSEVDLLEIHRSAFLTAVTGHDASRRAAWGVARAFHPVLTAEEPIAGSPQ